MDQHLAPNQPEPTEPTEPTTGTPMLRSRATAEGLGAELAWYVDLRKKAFRPVTRTLVLGVFEGGLVVESAGAVVVAPWADVEYLCRRHSVSLGGLNKNREDRLVFSVAGHGRLTVSHNRGGKNPGEPLEPVSELAAATYGTWGAARATAALAAGRRFAFGDVVVERNRVTVGEKKVPITEDLGLTVSDRSGDVTITAGQDRHTYDHTQVSSAAALTTVLIGIGVGRRPASSRTGADRDTLVVAADDSPTQRAARAAARQAGLGAERTWFATTSRFRGRAQVLGVFDDGFVTAKEGDDPDVVPWSAVTGAGPVGVTQPAGIVSFKIGVTDGKVREFTSSGGVFPTRDKYVHGIAAALTGSFDQYSVRTLRAAVARDGQVTYGSVTIDAEGVRRTVPRTQVRLDFDDVAELRTHVLPGALPQLAMIAREVSSAPAGFAVRLIDVPNLHAFTSVVAELRTRRPASDR
jgi:hypothetical protein